MVGSRLAIELGIWVYDRISARLTLQRGAYLTVIYHDMIFCWSFHCEKWSRLGRSIVVVLTEYRCRLIIFITAVLQDIEFCLECRNALQGICFGSGHSSAFARLGISSIYSKRRKKSFLPKSRRRIITAQTLLKINPVLHITNRRRQVSITSGSDFSRHAAQSSPFPCFSCLLVVYHAHHRPTARPNRRWTSPSTYLCAQSSPNTQNREPKCRSAPTE